MALAVPWYALSRIVTATNLQIVDNVITLPDDQQGNYAVYLRNWHGVTITGNDFLDLPVRALDCSDVTFSDNGSSSLVTT